MRIFGKNRFGLTAAPAALLVTALALTACSRDAEPPVAVAQPADQAQPASTPAAGPELSAEVSAPTVRTEAPEVVVVNGLTEVIALWESENWWEGADLEQQLKVPHTMIAAIHPSWAEASKQLPVQTKKQVFYRAMLPLILHANSMVEKFRAQLEQARGELAESGAVSAESLVVIQRVSLLLPDMNEAKAATLVATTPELKGMLDQLLYRLDVIPPGLALGQAAYESGYGTSRFALEGNSMFGQWTYKGDGIVPGQQRKAGKGNHQIKAFEWPFDSVRGYFINLMSHPAYEDFRRMRAELRAAGKPLDSLVLADSLLSYSERGQDYVDSLKGMIRTNKLDIADAAVLRDEPIRFLVSERSLENVGEAQEELQRMRESGELAEIFERMRLE